MKFDHQQLKSLNLTNVIVIFVWFGGGFRAAGNEYFRQIVTTKVDIYLSARSKMEKGGVIISIVEAIQNGSPSAGFVRQDPRTGGWFVVDDATAREKVGATMRSLIKASDVEKSLLPNSIREDETDDRDDSVIQADHLLDWIPPSIVANVSLERQEGSLYVAEDFLSFKAELSAWEIFDVTLWKAAGLELNQEELNMLIEEADCEYERKTCFASCQNCFNCLSDYVPLMIHQQVAQVNDFANF